MDKRMAGPYEVFQAISAGPLEHLRLYQDDLSIKIVVACNKREALAGYGSIVNFQFRRERNGIMQPSRFFRDALSKEL